MNITVNDMIKAQKALNTANVPGPYYAYCDGSVAKSLADSPCAQPAEINPFYFGSKPAKKEKEENLMSLNYATKIAPVAYASVSAAPSDTQTKIDYLRGRARDVKETLTSALADQFRLYQSAGPKTAEDLIAAIKADAFTFDEKKVAKNKEYMESYGYKDGYYGPMDVLVFTNFPGPDKKGHAEAVKALKAEYQKIKDIINIKDADTALEAIQAFEGWTYTAPTVH